MATYKETADLYNSESARRMADFQQGEASFNNAPDSYKNDPANIAAHTAGVGNFNSGLTTFKNETFSNLANLYAKENPNGDYSSDFLNIAKDVGGNKYNEYSGLTLKNGVPTQKAAIAQDAANQAGVASGALQKVQVGTGTAYEPTGSAADKLTQGIASGAVSPTNPMQEFNASMQGNNTTAPGINPIAPKYQTALAQTNASGAPAPDTAGAAAPIVNGSIPPPPADTSNIDMALSQDKGYQQLLADRAEYTNVANQSKSLVDEYTQSLKDAGIPAINAELLNTKNIIDGTEEDIRKEVQAVSGFATDSQVLALAGARNKQLIKNYNNLLDTKTMAMESINTMMGLAQQDRTNALNTINQKMQIDEQLQSYRDKFVNNAKEAYNNVIKAVGYAGLYQSLQQDPSSIPLVEKTLGLASGGLKQLATYKALPDPMDALQLENQQLQNQKLKKELNTPVGGSNTLSVSEAQSLGVPYGTTEAQAKKMGIVPGSVNGVDEKTMAKIQSSPEYKTINGVLPAIQALSSYKEAINKYGTAEIISGAGKGELSGTYGNAIAAWKTLAGLGALSGADFALAENAVPSTGFFQRSSTMLGKINASIDNAVSQATNLTQRLGQNYPTAKENLNTQLDYAKAIAYPDKYKVAPDGTVIEITN